MTPARPDPDTIQRRLRLMRDALDQLSSLKDLTADDLDADSLERAAAERLLHVIVDFAVDINGHLVTILTGRAPETGRASFLALAACDVIPLELAERIAPTAGLRNVLVHHYLDIRTDLVARAIGAALDEYPDYVSAIATYLDRLT